MKFFSLSIYSLNSRTLSILKKLPKQLLVDTSNRTRCRDICSISDSLYRRISPLGDPNASVGPVLDQWISEGNHPYRGEFRRIINELMCYKRFKHALEVSLWMTNKQRINISSFDVSVRLKLINKVLGLEHVENYFNKIPENLKDFKVYLALLNCYVIAKSVDKAESIMQQARDLGYVSKPLWYNLVMNMHCQLGNKKKVYELLEEMKAKGICFDQFTYAVCLSACTLDSDVEKMDKILTMMESKSEFIIDWKTYVIAVRSYLRMGLTVKALAILHKLEKKLTNKNNILFEILLSLYGEAGHKEKVCHVWNLCKQKGKVGNKVYINVLRSLRKFGDIETMEKIFEEWELSGAAIDFRVPNYLIDFYCADGRVDKAEALITRLISKGGERSVSTWCHLAGGYLKKGKVPEAVEALKKANFVCPPRFKSQKDSLTTCLQYLETGNCIEKAEELIKLISTGLGTSTVLNDLSDLNDDKN